MKKLFPSAVLAASIFLAGCTQTQSRPKPTNHTSATPAFDSLIANANRCIERQDRMDALHVCSSVNMLELKKKNLDLANAVSAALNKARKADNEYAELGRWYYHTWKDDATGKNYKVASVESENRINLDFPYSEKQHAHLKLRKHPRWGFDAYLSIDQGQILCDSYSNTTVIARADNGPIKSYRCGSPADHSSDTVFIKDFQGLETQIKGANKMYVTVSIYQEGSRTFEFKVKGYDSTRI